jgi:hypothetical protein
MRDAPLVILIASLLTLNISAQIRCVKEYPPQFDNSRQIWLEVVENQDSRPIVAMETKFYCQSNIPTKESESGGGYDALGNGVTVFNDYKGIPPGGVATINGADPSRCRGGVDGVIFSSGESEGNSRWVSESRQRWIGVRDGIIQSLPLLTKVANQEADLMEFEDFLRDHMESIPDGIIVINGTFDERKMGERAFYFNLESVLRSSRDVRRPSDSTPHSQLRSNEIRVNGVSTEQRKMVIFLVNKLKQWKSALENGLGSPVAN